MKASILIVEDDKAVQRLMAAAMDNAGYHQEIAANGAEAVTLALSLQPQVILLDLGLPDTDGVEVIRKLRSWTETPIIVVSARSDDRDKIEALDAGADDYLTKPFSVDELLARIRVACARRAMTKAVPVSSGLCQWPAEHSTMPRAVCTAMVRRSI